MNYKRFYLVLFLFCFSSMPNILSMGKREKPVGRISQTIEIDFEQNFLAQALEQNGNKFCEELEEFVWNHFSYYDFPDSKNIIRAKQRSIIFFLLGFLNRLDDSKYQIRVSEDSILIKKNINRELRDILEFKIISPDQNIDIDDINSEKIKKLCEFNEPADFNRIGIICFGKRIKCNYFDAQNININDIENLKIKFNDFKLFDSPDSVISFLKQKNWFKFKNYINFELEKDFHTFFLGLLANTEKIVSLSSNHENGNGRPDIVIKTLKFAQIIDGKVKLFFDKYVFEFKVSFDDNNLSNKMREAINQISDKGYGVASVSRNILKSSTSTGYGIALSLESLKVSIGKKDLKKD